MTLSLGTERLLWAMFCCCLAACSPSSDRVAETYTLPNAYVGSFHIIFSKNAKNSLKEATDSRRYEVPDSGVLWANMPLNEGWIEEDKITFYYRENGALIEITGRHIRGLEDNEQNRSDTEITVFGGSIGESESIYVDCKIEHQTFYVGTKANLLDGVNHFEILDFLKNQKDSATPIDCTGMESSGLESGPVL